MISGKIVRVNPHRGFGWIARHDGQGDLFFGFREFQIGIDISEGLEVVFDIGADREGRAIAVSIRPT